MNIKCPVSRMCLSHIKTCILVSESNTISPLVYLVNRNLLLCVCVFLFSYFISRPEHLNVLQYILIFIKLLNLPFFLLLFFISIWEWTISIKVLLDRIPSLCSLSFCMWSKYFRGKRALASWKSVSGRRPVQQSVCTADIIFQDGVKRGKKAKDLLLQLWFLTLEGGRNDEWPSGQCASFPWETGINPSHPALVLPY